MCSYPPGGLTKVLLLFHPLELVIEIGFNFTECLVDDELARVFDVIDRLEVACCAPVLLGSRNHNVFAADRTPL
jgi:hypothetical protein